MSSDKFARLNKCIASGSKWHPVGARGALRHTKKTLNSMRQDTAEAATVTIKWLVEARSDKRSTAERRRNRGIPGE